MSSTRQPKESYLLPILITLAALGARIYTAGWGGLSDDEVFCVNIADVTTWSQMFHYIELDGNPPLIYVLLRLWGILFGTTDFGFRCFAILASTAIVPVSYFMFRRQLGIKVAAQIAILFAFCPPMIEFGTLVRGYALLSILSLLATWQLITLLDNPRKRGQQVKYAVLLAAMVYLHYWGAMVAIGHAILMTAGLLRRWWQPDQVKSWLWAVAGSILLYAPWALVLARQMQLNVSPWMTAPDLRECLFYMPVEAVAGYVHWLYWLNLSSHWLYWLNLSWADIAILGSLLAPFVMASVSQSKENLKLYCWQIPALGGLSAAALISQVRPIWRDRYLTAFSPLLIVTYVMVCDRLLKRFPAWASAVLPLAVWLAIWPVQLQFFHQFPESSAWILSEQLGKAINPKKDLVVISFQSMAPMINRYLPKNVPSISFPDMERVDIFRWAGVESRIRDDSRLDTLLARMKGVLDSGGDIWLVERVHLYLPFDLHYRLNKLKYTDVEAVRMCQVRHWLLQNARKDKEDLWAPGREFPAMASRFRPKTAQPERMR